MKVKQIAETINEMVPLKLAQGWDNVGLLIGDAEKDVKKILMAIDVTKSVAAEAKKLGADMIVSYHPIIWDGLKKITVDGPSGVVYDLIRSGISVFSVHTALDTVCGGVNDMLAEVVGIVDGEPIGDYVENPAGENFKLVLFVPKKSLAKVSNAVFAAGAGFIGNYSRCSFNSEGVGTFLPLEGAKPTIGKKGKCEKVEEVKFEAIVEAAKIGDVVAAMRKAHRYEEPAFDVIRLTDVESKFGLGRIGKLGKAMSLDKIIERIKKQTGAKAVGLVGKKKRIVRSAAVCAGSCGKIIDSAIAKKCDLYLTGELKHHQALAAAEAGMTCICLSHTVSERFAFKRVATQLQQRIKNVTIRFSKTDTDPFEWKNI